MINNKYFKAVVCLVALVVVSSFFYKEVILNNVDMETTIPTLNSESNKNESSRTPISKSISSSLLIKKEKTIKEKKTDGSTASSSVEANIPWKELDRQWMDEVQKLLVSLDSLEGEEVFQRYLKERLAYRKKDEIWRIQIRKVLKEKPINKILQKKLENQSGQMIAETEERTKNILGKYYTQVADLHHEFTESIQVYSRDIPIAVDSGIY